MFELSENEKKTLSHFVTNMDSNVFVLRNLPEVIKGALFSRYSRSVMGLRPLLLKEFIMGGDSLFHLIAEEGKGQKEEQLLAIQKAQNFYDRILDGYGDDSIGELGGAHLAVEEVTLLAAKVIEDCRIGGSPLEKSTRYIYFDQKDEKGNYRYYRDPNILTSAYKELYIKTCDHLFATYTKLSQELTKIMEEKYPKSSDISETAYHATIRAKVLDCLRGLLPASTLTNLGVFGNGRFYEGLLRRLHASTLPELQDIGKKAEVELFKVIPSFVRRACSEHHNFISHHAYVEKLRRDLKELAVKYAGKKASFEKGYQVRLVDASENPVQKVAMFLFFEYTDMSIDEVAEQFQNLPESTIREIFEIIVEGRENRRHKSPRALEHANFTFEIVADFGVYRDLQRHRMLTQQRKPLTCHLGYMIPDEIRGTSMEVLYVEAMEMAKKTFDVMHKDLPEEAQYVVPMGYNIHWYFHVNLRALQWMTELRSMKQGHLMYRKIAQDMASLVIDHYPAFEPFFHFVDWEDTDLGRLEQEKKQDGKRQKIHA